MNAYKTYFDRQTISPAAHNRLMALGDNIKEDRRDGSCCRHDRRTVPLSLDFLLSLSIFSINAFRSSDPIVFILITDDSRISNPEDKGTVLLSLEMLRLFAEIAKLPIIIIVDIPQEVKGAPKGRRGAYCTPPSVGQFFRTEEPSPCLLSCQDRRPVPLSSTFGLLFPLQFHL